MIPLVRKESWFNAWASNAAEKGLDAGDYDAYNNGYVTDVFGYKQAYPDNIGLSEAQYPSN